MITTSIQNVYSVTPVYTEQRVYVQQLDPKTLKETTEFITYRVYTRSGQIEENQRPTVDIRA